MKKFVIITDSGCDLNTEVRQKYGIDYVPMHYTYDGKDFEADLDWATLPARDFYDIMRGGKRILSSAVNVSDYLTAFEKYASEGYDILSLSTTSALSTSVNSSYVARDELIKKYPDVNIVCIDTACACTGLGLLCVKASKLRAEGKSMDEIASWVNENKKFVNQEGTVDKLTWLKQAGRVSAVSAFFGNLLNVKPLVISDIHGYNVAIEKVKGRKVSLERVATRVAEEYIPNDLGIFINHADCLEDANTLKNIIKEKTGLQEEQFTMGYIGPAIGASVGPGMLGVYFLGKEVTYDSLEHK